MQSQSQERHVLVINNGKGRHTIALEAAAYSVGRDLTNAIVLDFDTVSRQHAILLRVPVPGTNRYKYRLVDGNSDGKPSTNGIFVNGQRCGSHELSNGDLIGFGRKITASYLSVAMAENEFVHYLESIKYQSIKSKQVDPKATLAGVDFAHTPETAIAELSARELVSVGGDSSATPPARATSPDLSAKETASGLSRDSQSSRNPTLPDTLHESGKPSTQIAGVWLTAAVCASVVGAGLWFYVQSRANLPQSNQSTPATTSPAHPAP